MKLIGIIGIPGTGKTTLMKEWMASKEWVAGRPVELLDSHLSGNIRVLGKYEDGETFAGTDRLSMAVQPKVIEYLKDNKTENVIFEGDRLSSVKLFQAAQSEGYDVSIICLSTSDDEVQRRYDERGSDQSEKFIQGRQTKVDNIRSTFGPTILTGEEGCIIEETHQTPEDTKRICELIDKLLI